MDNQFLINTSGAANRKSPRYLVEHKILPYLFYNGGPRFLGTLLSERGSALCALYDEILGGLPNPYKPSDFTFIPRVFSDELNTSLVLQIIMPEPEKPLHCTSVYLCIEAPVGERLYITSEYSFDSRSHLCAWMEGPIHFHFSAIDPEMELEYVLEKFQSRESLYEIVQAYQERIEENEPDSSEAAD